MISQVLTNYLSNAIDHTPKGGRIAVFGEKQADKELLTVYNEGSHIPEQEIPKIWQSFYKLDQARTRAFGGTGIGLSIVKTILDAHGMTCGVDCADGLTCFWFCYPKQH